MMIDQETLQGLKAAVMAIDEVTEIDVILDELEAKIKKQMGTKKECNYLLKWSIAMMIGFGCLLLMKPDLVDNTNMYFMIGVILFVSCLIGLAILQKTTENTIKSQSEYELDRFHTRYNEYGAVLNIVPETLCTYEAIHYIYQLCISNQVDTLTQAFAYYEEQEKVWNQEERRVKKQQAGVLDQMMEKIQTEMKKG